MLVLYYVKEVPQARLKKSCVVNHSNNKSRSITLSSGNILKFDGGSMILNKYLSMSGVWISMSVLIYSVRLWTQWGTSIRCKVKNFSLIVIEGWLFWSQHHDLGF